MGPSFYGGVQYCGDGPDYICSIIYIYIGNEWFPSPTIFPLGMGLCQFWQISSLKAGTKMLKVAAFAMPCWDAAGRPVVFFVGGKPSAVHLVYTCLHHAFFIRKIGIWLDMYYPAKRTTVCVYIYMSLSLCVCVQTEYLSVESSLQKSSFDLFFGAANLRVF